VVTLRRDRSELGLMLSVSLGRAYFPCSFAFPIPPRSFLLFRKSYRFVFSRSRPLGLSSASCDPPSFLLLGTSSFERLIHPYPGLPFFVFLKKAFFTFGSRARVRLFFFFQPRALLTPRQCPSPRCFFQICLLSWMVGDADLVIFLLRPIPRL